MSASHYYHYATKGLEDDVLFGSTAAFVAAMNRVAICAVRANESFPVKIICFCLMDNHVHFIFHGTEENCNKFMDTFKWLTEIWIKNHPEEGPGGKDWDIGHWIIKDLDSLREKIIYVHRNPTVAKLPILPGGYRWSSASIVFTDLQLLNGGTRIGDLSRARQIKLLGSKVQVPEDWIILPDGYIWPGCYVSKKRIEDYFKSAVEYQYWLTQNIEGKVNAEMMKDNVSLPDGDIRKRAVELSIEMFSKEDIAALSLEERVVMSKILRKEFGSSIKQIARIVRIKMEDLKKLI